MKRVELRSFVRKAIVPMWEVKSTMLQTNNGDPNAGLTEEEGAAKAGLLGFDWDGKGFLKPTDWIDKEDGFLMLDRDANGYVTTGNDLLSNPLIADPGKGLRILAAYDANGDGIIDARDPVYGELKVWRDLNQDGNNVTPLTVGDKITASQDQTDGQLELRSLADVGITAIDYVNSRFAAACTVAEANDRYQLHSYTHSRYKGWRSILCPIRRTGRASGFRVLRQGADGGARSAAVVYRRVAMHQRGARNRVASAALRCGIARERPSCCVAVHAMARIAVVAQEAHDD